MTAKIIYVPPSPTPTQIAAGLRQFVLLLGGAATALGLSGVANGLDGVLASVGIAASVISFVWGQLHTRAERQRLITTADAAPSTVAQVTTK